MPPVGIHRLRLLLPFAAALLGSAGSVRGQEAQAAGLLYKSDLIRLLTSDAYDVVEIRRIVGMSCVGFEPSARDREDIRRFPGGITVLDEIERCRDRSGPSGYRDGVPVATPVESAAGPAIEVAAPSREGAGGDGPVAADPGAPPSGLPGLVPPRLGSRLPPPTLPGVRPDAPPRLLNWDAVIAEILAGYRPDVRQPGEVVLRVRVAADGSPGEAEIRSATGDPALAEAALAAVSAMRFAPAESRSRPVESWALIPVRFATR